MPDYRRAFQPGGTFFFTRVTERRAPILCSEIARSILHKAIAQCGAARPFKLEAIVLLPDHVHMVWILPPGDSDYSTRVAAIKAHFTHAWLGAGGTEQPRTGSRLFHRRRGVWQRRFWEHQIRDADDLHNHIDYIHYNPVKHQYALCPHEWKHSSFESWAARQKYEATWCCSCHGLVEPPRFLGLDEKAIEMGE